ncbi:hypothetical protein F7734_08485 [Scytonema sp. UIC 10036]|nr:hypothetical protein [Scytonema sp. UIC 10036]
MRSHYEPTIPPQVTYGLTERGKELTKALAPLYKFALRWNAPGLPQQHPYHKH